MFRWLKERQRARERLALTMERQRLAQEYAQASKCKAPREHLRRELVRLTNLELGGAR